MVKACENSPNIKYIISKGTNQAFCDYATKLTVCLEEVNKQCPLPRNVTESTRRYVANILGRRLPDFDPIICESGLIVVKIEFPFLDLIDQSHPEMSKTAQLLQCVEDMGKCSRLLVKSTDMEQICAAGLLDSVLKCYQNVNTQCVSIIPKDLMKKQITTLAILSKHCALLSELLQRFRDIPNFHVNSSTNYSVTGNGVGKASLGQRMNVLDSIKTYNFPFNNSILQVKLNCGRLEDNKPVIYLMSDVDIVAWGRCVGGDQNFTSYDNVHYTLPGTINQRNDSCRFHGHSTTNTYVLEIEIGYGHQHNSISNSGHILTITCIYSKHGKDQSSSHQIIDGGFSASELIEHRIGPTINSSNIKLSVQNVLDENIDQDMVIGRKYSLFAGWKGDHKINGLRPISCSVSSAAGEVHMILKAGCGDGLIFDKKAGFTTKEMTFRSPYFDGFKFSRSNDLSFRCNVAICSSNCDGSSCEIVCGVPMVTVTSGYLDHCTGNNHYQDNCYYKCNVDYINLLDGVSTCGIDGIWTKPNIICIATG